MIRYASPLLVTRARVGPRWALRVVPMGGSSPSVKQPTRVSLFSTGRMMVSLTSDGRTKVEVTS